MVGMWAPRSLNSLWLNPQWVESQSYASLRPASDSNLVQFEQQPCFENRGEGFADIDEAHVCGAVCCRSEAYGFGQCIYEVESAEVGLEPDLVGVDGLLLLFVAPPGESVVHDALKYLAHHRHEGDEAVVCWVALIPSLVYWPGYVLAPLAGADLVRVDQVIKF